MLKEIEQPTVFEGSRDEIVSQLQQLPDQNYHVEIVGVNAGVNGLAPPNAALEEAIRKMTSRTHEEMLASRARILAKSRPPRPLPPGKTLEDVVAGTWPGDETDEEIFRALEELS